MFETRNAAAEIQQEFWIDARRLPRATASAFYRKLDETFDAIGCSLPARFLPGSVKIPGKPRF